MEPPPRVRVVDGLLLLLILVQPWWVPQLGASTPNRAIAQPDGQKLIIDAADLEALGRVKADGGDLLADYGSFSLCRVRDHTARALQGRSTVALRNDFDTIFLRTGPLDTRTSTPGVPATLQQTRRAEPQFWLVQLVGPVQDA